MLLFCYILQINTFFSEYLLFLILFLLYCLKYIILIVCRYVLLFNVYPVVTFVLGCVFFFFKNNQPKVR